MTLAARSWRLRWKILVAGACTFGDLGVKYTPGAQTIQEFCFNRRVIEYGTFGLFRN
jgi:hypothetical protein